jgi:hypothetical protein
MATNNVASESEVAAQQLAHVFGVSGLRERGEADQVNEEDGDQTHLGGSGWCCRRGGRWSVRG